VSLYSDAEVKTQKSTGALLNAKTNHNYMQLEERVYLKRVRLFFGHAVGNVASALVGALFIGTSLYSANVEVYKITIWALIILGLAGVVAYVELAFSRTKLHIGNAHHWVSYRIATGALVGFALGVSAFMLPESVDIYYGLFLFIILSAVVAVASTAYSTIPLYYIILDIAAMAPLTVYYILRPGPLDTLLVLSVVIWQILVVAKAWKVSLTSIDAIRVNELLRDEVSEHEKTRALLEHLASHDSLTNLPNRQFMVERLNFLISQAKRSQQKMAVMFIDIDGFKTINDEHGHDAGDAVLKEIANRFKQQIRESDMASRVGGDEFIVVCHDLSDHEFAAEVLAERILKSMSAPFLLPNNHYGQISCSIGIAIYPQDGDDSETLIKSADIAMYRVKSKEKNDFCFATTGLEKI
jgi:diguanylate cyclase (GGDEF)-like protein